MSKISINLLPIEFKIDQLKRAKFYKVQVIGVLVFMVVVFFSSLVVALRILQSSNISQIKNKVSASEQKVSDLKSTQAALLLLKNRLSAINLYIDSSSKQAQVYKFIVDTSASLVSLNSVSIDREGNITGNAVSNNGNSLDEWINGLISKEKNKDKVNKVSLESLSRGRDGIYRLSFKIVAK